MIELTRNGRQSKTESSNGETIGRAVAIFLDDCKYENLSPATVEWYERHLRRFFGYGKVVHFTTERITDNLLVELRDIMDAEVTKVNLNAHLRAAKRFLNWCDDNGRPIDCNTRRMCKQVRLDEKIPDHLTDEEIRRLLASFDETDLYSLRDKVLTALLIDTGTRISETLNIRISDIDGTHITLHDTKGNSDRVVAMSPPMAELMYGWLEQLGDEEDGYLFPSRQNERLSRRQYATIIKRAAERAGIKKRVYAHLCRHSYATSCLNAGMDVSHLQRALGHKDISMSLRYARLHSEVSLQASQAASPLNRVMEQPKKRSLRGRSRMVG